MWSVPYDYNLYSNWLGVGISAPGVTTNGEGNTWFNQMYHDSSSDTLGFSRKEYYSESSTLIYKDDKLQISGIMTTGHHAIVRITVRPVDDSDLADSHANGS
ncbi:hypothetical protein ACJMK2_038353 [Sinanodonta woodiana]|uniref:Uncharacterized protein n=1 Tax=Sinanodonta woodiana TaxID=1069815 RepID=A0ABD3W8Q5_SINWO